MAGVQRGHREGVCIGHREGVRTGHREGGEYTPGSSSRGHGRGGGAQGGCPGHVTARYAAPCPVTAA
eukprot:1085098-Rhodomonas_salina.1